MEYFTIVSSKKDLKEARAMLTFLKKKGIDAKIESFVFTQTDKIENLIYRMASRHPVINAPVLSGGSLRNIFVCGLKKTKKHIEQIKKYYWGWMNRTVP